MFNPRPRLEVRQIADDIRVVIIDDALAQPQAWVERAASLAEAFQRLPHNAFPGLELILPDAVSAEMVRCFDAHARAHLDARRCLEAWSRLALVTDAPEQLQPRQWICHRDRLLAQAGQSVAASVLYLFEDAALGGTGFYRARRSEADTARLIHDSGQLDGAEFSRRYGIQPGYLLDSNAWFERLGGIEPRFNRLIIYDGMQFHSSDIPHPERLSADPRRGRLTLNAFYTCRRRA